MTQPLWTEVDQYITRTVVRPDSALEAALRASAEAGLPTISVSPNQGKLLHLLARARGASRILEIGTLGGYSAIWLARALPAGGLLITLESEPAHAEVARGNLVRAGVADRVEIRLGPAHRTLRDLVAGRSPAFDLVFIDADKEGYPDYLEWAIQLSRPGTLIVADNVVRDGRVIDVGSEDPRVQGVRRFNQLLAEHPRIEATEVQTVGVKGYDGMAIALVTD